MGGNEGEYELNGGPTVSVFCWPDGVNREENSRRDIEDRLKKRKIPLGREGFVAEERARTSRRTSVSNLVDLAQKKEDNSEGKRGPSLRLKNPAYPP